MNRLGVRDLDVEGKRVFLRVDMNVPLDDEGAVTDDRRIVAVIPTVKLLLERGAVVILASHMGRPDGRRNASLSLAPAAERVGELLDRPVRAQGDCVGDAVEAAVAAGVPGDVFVLENLRFHPGEKAGDPDFAAALAKLADVYVTDAFGTSHRAHASITRVPKLLDHAAAGLLMTEELEHLGALLVKPRRPFLLVLGGAKVSDKVPMLRHLIPLVDTVIVGGGMAYTFLAAQGEAVGNSRVEPDLVSTCRELLAAAEERGQKVLLPHDHVCAPRIEEGVETVTSEHHVPDGLTGLDIGPGSARLFASHLKFARTVLWNGPMGVFELDEFATGTKAVARTVAKITDRGAKSVVGGGDTAAAAQKFGVTDRMSHVSTGGGATLEFFGGGELPGVAALSAVPVASR